MCEQLLRLFTWTNTSVFKINSCSVYHSDFKSIVVCSICCSDADAVFVWFFFWGVSMIAVGFDPTPLRTGAWSQRLRPLGQTVLAQVTGGLQNYMSWPAISTISSHLGDMAHVQSWCVYFKKKVNWYTCSVHQIKGSCCWRPLSRPSCQETCWQQEIARLQMQQQKIIGLGVPPHIQTWFFHARGMNPLIAPPRPAASRSKINEFGNPLN